MTSPCFIKYSTLQSNGRGKTLDINGIDKCFSLVTQANICSIQHQLNHLKEYSYSLFSYTILLRCVKDCCFMDDSIAMIEDLHHFINKFRSIVTSKTMNFKSRLPFKYGYHIVDSNTSVFFGVQQPFHWIATTDLNNDQYIQKSIPSRDGHRASEIHNNQLYLGVLVITGLREGKAMQFSICTSTVQVVKILRYVYIQTLNKILMVHRTNSTRTQVFHATVSETHAAWGFSKVSYVTSQGHALNVIKSTS